VSKATTTFRLALHTAVTFAVLGACSKEPVKPPAPEPTRVQLTGSGSSLVAPLMSQWDDAFQKAHPDVQINYQSNGSNAGISQVTEGAVDFAGTEAPLTDLEMGKLLHDKGYGLYHLPAAVGGDVPAYNLPGLTQDLRFTPAVLAGAFLGTIKKWNAPEIAAANPGVTLPDAEIAIVHRSDGSGTTYVWTDYLSKVSEAWNQRVGKGATVAWPVGVGAKGNEGVAEKIQATPYSLGYVELVYATKLKIAYGFVQNSTGEFVKADLASLTAAAARASQSRPEDYRISITDGQGPGVYPIAGFSWLLVPGEIADPAKGKAILAFLNWALTSGQGIAESMSYARLPSSVIANERLTLRRIRVSALAMTTDAG
jgi:phosphate transport system substrate-binding protein